VLQGMQKSPYSNPELPKDSHLTAPCNGVVDRGPSWCGHARTAQHQTGPLQGLPITAHLLAGSKGGRVGILRCTFMWREGQRVDSARLHGGVRGTDMAQVWSCINGMQPLACCDEGLDVRDCTC
jgi:hypothetical protein